MKKFIFLSVIIFITSSCLCQNNKFNKKPWESETYPIIIDPYQGNNIDFDQLITDKRVVGIIHKASQGLKPDNKYLSRGRLARSRNLLYASYHLGTNSDPMKQADFYLDIIKNDSNEPMALDIEDIGGSNISLPDAEKFINRIYEKTNHYPIVYVNDKVFNAINKKYNKESVFAKCPLWYARFVAILPSLNKNVWDSVTFWQFSCEINCKATGKCLYNVPGTRYDMDVNIYNGELNDLRIFWANFANLNTQLPIDNYIRDNFTISSSTKKQILGKNLKCGYEEVYFVKGYNTKQELVERNIVFRKNGVYEKSVAFFRWCANNDQVKYSYSNLDFETPEDLKTFIINYHPNGKIYIINATLLAKKELKTDPDGIFETTFESYLDQLVSCN